MDVKRGKSKKLHESKKATEYKLLTSLVDALRLHLSSPEPHVTTWPSSIIGLIAHVNAHNALTQ